MQQKRDDGSARTLPGIQCRSCIHHSRVPHPQVGVKKTCDKIGILPSGDAPAVCFRPDVLAIVEVDHSWIEHLRQFHKNTNPRLTQVMAHTLLNTQMLSRLKLEFGQRVAFCIGSDFLQNYFRGVVLAATPDGEFVYVSSSLSPGSANTMLTLLRSSLLTKDQWLKKKQQLIKQNRVQEPRTRSNRPTLFEELEMPRAEWLRYRESLVTKPEDYKPPSLDSVPQHWLDKRRLLSIKEDVAGAVKSVARKSRATSAKKMLKKQMKAGANGKLLINRYA